MSATAVEALNEALAKLLKDRGRLEQAIAVATNENTGRAPALQVELAENEKEERKVLSLIEVILEGM